MRSRDEELLSKLAANVRKFRSEAGYSQESFALEAGLHRTYISHVERAKVNISLANAARIARALDVGIDDLLAD